MNMRRLISAALAFAVGACDASPARDRIDVKAAAVGAPDLTALEGIMLQMSTTELKSLRPVRFLPYTGYADSVGNVEFWFQYPLAGDAETQSRLAHLEAVYARRTMASDSAAMAAFRDKVDVARRAGRKPSSCFEEMDGSATVTVEFEPIAGAHLQIGYRTGSSGPVTFERVSSDPMLENEGRSRRPCHSDDFGQGSLPTR